MAVANALPEGLDREQIVTTATADYFVHHEFRKPRRQPNGTKFRWLETIDGVRARYGTAPGGVPTLITVALPKHEFDRERARAWFSEHDEVDIAMSLEMDGPVLVNIVETFNGIGAGDQAPPVDRGANVIRGALVCGWESSNNRSYRQVLRRAAPMYEGRFVSLNHPAPGAPVTVESRFGQYRNPSIDDKYGARGDLHYNPKHPAAEQLLWFAENMPGAVANSHRIHAVGKRNRETGVFEVTDFDRVLGVELVADGGTTRGMFEGAIESAVLDADGNEGGRRRAIVTKPDTETDDMDLKDLTLAQLREGRPDLIESVSDALKAADEYKALVAERDKLKTENAELTDKLDAIDAAGKLAERRTALRAQCEEAKMPKELVTDVFVESLVRMDEDDKDGIKAAIDDRLKLARKGPTSTVRERAELAGGNLTEGEKPKDAKSFAASLKG